jgi:transcriptional regulator GlxA family with amidase domain
MDAHPIPEQEIFRIGFLLIDGFALMSYAAVVEPLRAANMLLGNDHYELRQIPATGTFARSSSGATIAATELPGERRDYDLVLVIAGGEPASFRDDRVFHWLHRLARHGVRLGGVSGGPVILATAGLMADRRMTVHWEHAEALAEISPNLMIERSLYVMDRDRITCAGGIAPLDLMHALLVEHHGPDFARRISDWYMHTEVRPAGGPQRAGLALRYGVNSPALITAIEAMENHIADPLALSHLAQICGLSSRQLNRLFHDHLGESTMHFYRSLRLEKARTLIQQSPLTMTEIALATGFATSSHFSSAYREHFGDRPGSLRG